MRASSNSHGEKARRTSRTAPRRHTDPNERPVSATYDSNEFPVLLRMPDLHEGDAESEAAVAKTEHRLDLQPPPIQTPVPPGTRRSRTRSRDTEKQSTPATASRSFWGNLAPKIAVGGMLLSITALCVVVLQSPNQDPSTDASETKWAAEEGAPQVVGESTPTIPVSHPTTPSDPGVAGSDEPRHAVAAKPDSNRSIAAPSIAAPSFSGAETHSDIGPIQSIPAAVPSIDKASSPSTPTPAFQAQGWPDELDAGVSSDSNESQVELNPALRSAFRTTYPRTNASSEANTIAPPAAQQPAGETRLNGTVEIPKPPQAKYRL